MNLSRKTSSFVLLLPFLMTSCETAYRYALRDPSVSLAALTEKGDYQVTGRIAGNSDQGNVNGSGLSGYDLEGAYALSDQWSVAAGYSGRRGDYAGIFQSFGTFDSTHLHYYNNAWQLGTTFMLKLHNKFYFSPSAGFGGGVFNFIDHEFDSSGAVKPTDFYHASRVLTGYVQPAFYIKGNWLEFGFGWRISFNQFLSVATTYSDAQAAALSIGGLQGSGINLSQAFLLLRFNPGTRAIRLEFQAGSVAGLSSNTQYFNYYNFNASMGICIDPYQWIKEKRRRQPKKKVF